MKDKFQNEIISFGQMLGERDEAAQKALQLLFVLFFKSQQIF
jgi:hypothetical protein